MRVMLSLLLSAALLRSAPAPAPRPRPAPAFPAGTWLLSWAGVEYRMTLSPGGRYDCRTESSSYAWAGEWRYDPSSRVLAVREGECPSWHVRLREDLTGVARYAGSDPCSAGIPVALKREGGRR